MFGTFDFRRKSNVRMLRTRTLSLIRIRSYEAFPKVGK